MCILHLYHDQPRVSCAQAVCLLTSRKVWETQQNSWVAKPLQQASLCNHRTNGGGPSPLQGLCLLPSPFLSSDPALKRFAYFFFPHLHRVDLHSQLELSNPSPPPALLVSNAPNLYLENCNLLSKRIISLRLHTKRCVCR